MYGVGIPDALKTAEQKTKFGLYAVLKDYPPKRARYNHSQYSSGKSKDHKRITVRVLDAGF